MQLNAIITEFKCTAQSVASDTNNTIDYYLELGVSHFTSSCDSVQVQDIAKAIACWKSASYFARAQKEIIKEASIMSNILYASQRLIGAQAYPCFSSVWLGIWRQMYGLIKINAMAAASSSPSSSPASETWSGLITQILAHLVPEDAALPVLGHPQQNSASSNNVTPYTSCWMMQATTNVGNSYLQQGDACQACKWFIATLALCTHSLKFVPWISHGESWNSLYRREAAIAQVRCLISLSIAYGHNHLNQEVEASQAIVKAEIAFQGLMELIDTRSSEIIALEAALAAAVASIKAHQSRYYEAAVAQFKAFRLYEAIGDDVSQSTCKLDLSRSCLNIAMNIATCNWIENEDAHLANSIDAVKSVLVGVHQGEISGISSRSLLEEEYEYRLLTSGGGGIGGLVWKISRNGIIDKSIGLEFLQISRTLSSAASLNSSYAAATSEICKSIMMDVKRISAFSNLPLESSPTQRVSDCIYLGNISSERARIDQRFNIFFLAWSKMSVDPSRSITIIGQLLEGTSAELVADISPADKLYLRYIILYASAVLFVLKGGVDDDGASISSLKSAISILSMLSGLDVISADGDSAAVWLIDQVFHLKNIISSNVAAIHGLSLKSSCDLVTGLDSLLLYLQQVQLGDVYRVDEGENQQHRAQQHRANVCYVLRDHQLPESMVGSTSSNLLAKLWTSSACRVGVCISCVQMQQAGGLRTMGTVLTQQVSNSAPPSSAAQESEISTATASKSSSSLLPSATSLKLHFHSRRHHVGSGNRCKHVCEATVSSATSSSFVSEYTENLEAIPRSLIVPEKSTLTATPKPREARSSSLSLVNSANNTNGISNNNENNTRLSSYSVTLTSTEAIMSLMQRVSEADESMDPKLLAHLKQQLEDQILIFRHHIDKVSLLQHGGDRSFGSGVSQAGSASFGKGKSKDDDGTSADFVAANAHTAAALVSSSKITSSSPVLTTSSTILTTTTSMTESLDHSKQTPASAPESTHIFPSTPRTALSATSVPSPSHEHLPVYEL